MDDTRRWDTSRTGVYAITNKVNGKVYIGSAAQSFSYRWWAHQSKLRRNIHHNPHLQRAWNKYGEENFEFSVLCYCPPELCLEWEQVFIDAHKAYKDGYNRCPTAGSNLGIKFDDEFKKKISESAKGRKHTEETKKRISAAMSIEMKKRYASGWGRSEEFSKIRSEAAKKHYEKKRSEQEQPNDKDNK